MSPDEGPSERRTASSSASLSGGLSVRKKTVRDVAAARKTRSTKLGPPEVVVEPSMGTSNTTVDPLVPCVVAPAPSRSLIIGSFS